jgi:hypothetical protein
MKKYEQGIPAQTAFPYESGIKPQNNTVYESIILNKKLPKSEGMSLKEIKESGYLIKPDKIEEIIFEKREDLKKKQDKLYNKVKEFYKKNKSNKAAEEMFKEQELQMLKSGLLRLA